jgi:hypothetical protein
MGLVVRHTAYETLFGYLDPAVAALYPENSTERKALNEWAIGEHVSKLSDDLKGPNAIKLPSPGSVKFEDTIGGQYPFSGKMSMTLTRGGTRAGQVARQDGRDTVTHFNGTERVDGALVALPAGVDSLRPASSVHSWRASDWLRVSWRHALLTPAGGVATQSISVASGMSHTCFRRRRYSPCHFSRVQTRYVW